MRGESKQIRRASEICGEALPLELGDDIMAGRGPQSFKKRQKEQQRKEWQEEKRAKRLERKSENPGSGPPIERAEEFSHLDKPIPGLHPDT